MSTTENIGTKVPGGQRQLVRSILVDPQSYMTTLFTLVADTYDDIDPGTKQLELYTWTPETIKQTIESDFGIELPIGNFDRLMAAITLLTTDLFFQDARKFVDLANVISFDLFSPDQFDPADVEECAWAITEALLLVPPDEERDDIFCDDIRRYLGVLLEHEGYVDPPDILKIAIGPNQQQFVHANYSDDPELFSGITQTQQGKTQAVEQMVIANLSELADQLERLPLNNGSTKAMVDALRRVVAEKKQDEKPTELKDDLFAV